MDLQFAVVTDESESSELVHEETHPRPGCPDHLGKRLLTDLGDDGLRSALLAKIRQQKKSARQPLFARIEQLIDQIFFDANRTGQKMCDEQFGESRLFVEHARKRHLLDSHDLAFRDRGCRCHTPGLTGQTSLAAELILPEHGNDGLSASFGDDRELYPSLLNVKYRIGTIPLRVDPLIFAELRNSAACAHNRQECLRIERQNVAHEPGTLIFGDGASAAESG